MCEALSADDNDQQKVLLYRIVAMPTTLGQLDYAARVELGEKRLSQIDTNTDIDSLDNDGQAGKMRDLFFKRYRSSSVRS